MARIAIPTKEEFTEKTKPTLDRYERNLGDIVAETAFSFTTNLFNNSFRTDVDPLVPKLQTNYDAPATR